MWSFLLLESQTVTQSRWKPLRQLLWYSWPSWWWSHPSTWRETSDQERIGISSPASVFSLFTANLSTTSSIPRWLKENYSYKNIDWQHLGVRSAESRPLLRHWHSVAKSVRGRLQPDQLQREGECPAGGEQSVHQPDLGGCLQRLSAAPGAQGQHHLLQVQGQQELQDGQRAVVVHSCQ